METTPHIRDAAPGAPGPTAQLPLAGALALVVTLMLTASSCANTGARSDPDGGSGYADDPESWSVRREAFRSTHVLTGELAAVTSQKIIVPRIPNWQMPIRWMEADGAEVREGDRVLELDNSSFSGNLEQRRLEASRAVNELVGKRAEIAVALEDGEYRLEQARTRLAKARIEAEIPEELQPRREYQEKQLELRRSETELAKAEEELGADRSASDAELTEKQIELERARNRVSVAERAIDALVLRAPRDGILVVEENRREGRKYQVGDSVNVGRTVMAIPDLGAMKVMAGLYDVDDGRVTVGMPVSCVLDTYPDTTYTGRIVEITPVAQEQGRRSLRRTFRVVALLDDSDPARMRPGMSVRVVVHLPEIADALLAPRAGIDFEVDPPQALLADGSRVDVKLGPCNARRCVVAEGLVDGQRLEVLR